MWESYNGYYTWLPSRRCGFDTRLSLHNLVKEVFFKMSSIWQSVYEKFIEARKNHNEVDKSILGLLYNSLKNKAIELRVEELTDSDSINVIKKLSKQLDEEIECNEKVNRAEKVSELTYQKNLIQDYLPKQLSEDEIKNILATLEDKSIPSVMKYFKTNYNGLVDMSLVSKLARM